MNINSVSQALLADAVSSAGQALSTPGTAQEPSQFESMLHDKVQAGQKGPGSHADGESADGGTQSLEAGGSEEELLKSQLGLAAALLGFQPQMLSPELLSRLGQDAQRTQVQGADETASPLIPLAGQAVLATVPVPVEQATEQTKLPAGILESGGSPGAVAAAEEMIPSVQAQDQTGQKGLLSDSGGEEQSEIVHVETGAGEAALPDAALFRRVDTVPVKVAQPQQAELPAEHVVKQIEAPIKEALNQGASKIEVSLSPRSLGNLTVEITRSGDGSLYVLLNPSTEKAANLLEHHSASIQNLLAGDSQSQVRIEVQRQGEHQALQQFLNPEGQGRGQQGRQEQQQGSRKRETAENFVQQLRLGLIGLDEAVS